MINYKTPFKTAFFLVTKTPRLFIVFAVVYFLALALLYPNINFSQIFDLENSRINNSYSLSSLLINLIMILGYMYVVTMITAVCYFFYNMTDQDKDLNNYKDLSLLAGFMAQLFRSIFMVFINRLFLSEFLKGLIYISYTLAFYLVVALFGGLTKQLINIWLMLFLGGVVYIRMLLTYVDYGIVIQQKPILAAYKNSYQLAINNRSITFKFLAIKIAILIALFPIAYLGGLAANIQYAVVAIFFLIADVMVYKAVTTTPSSQPSNKEDDGQGFEI